MNTATIKVVNYEIVHQIKGRIRFRIPRLARDGQFAQRLVHAVMSLPGVTEARASSRSSSLVVVHSKEPACMDENGHVTEAAPSLAAQIGECIRLAAEADLAHETTPEMKQAAKNHNGAQEIDYLQRLGLPALGLGLSAGALAGMTIPGLLIGGVLLTASLPIFRRTIQGIREEKRLTVDFLDSTTIVLLTAQSSFLAPAVIIGIIEAAEIIRDWTARRNKELSLSLLLSQERQVLVERTQGEQRLSWDEIEVGDIVHVFPGDQIPVDGVVLSGSALVDQHQMTGDSAPVSRGAGDEVHAITIVVEGHLRILARRTGHETHAALVMALLHAAPNSDTRVSNYARKVGNWAVIPTLAAGGFVLATSGNLGRATGIVSLDLGTGMRVSAPIAVVGAQTNAAKQGILIRSGRALEALAQINAIVFDKTATLTTGRIEVIAVRPVHDGVSPDDVLQLAASGEQSLNHPVAQAITRHARERAIEPQHCTAWNYISGQGVAAEIEGVTIHVGSRALMIDVGVRMDSVVETEIATHVYVACKGELMGVILCADLLRPESAPVITWLAGQHISTYMLTGDSAPVAHATAARLAIAPHHVFAEALPQQKAERVQELVARGMTVAVVGDGINDAAAMAQAHVSIALGSATDLARETADVVLLNNDLRDLATAIEIARHSLRIIEQNQTMVVAPNLAAIAYGLMAVLNPGVAVIINNGTALAAALNSLRTLNQPGASATTDAPFVSLTNQNSDRVIDA